MAGWFNKLKSVVSSAIQKIKNILPLRPSLKQSQKITNVLTPLKDLKFIDASRYLKTKATIGKKEERKKLKEQNLSNQRFKNIFTDDEIKRVFTPDEIKEQKLRKKRVIIRRLLNKYAKVSEKPRSEKRIIPKETRLAKRPLGKKKKVIIRRLQFDRKKANIRKQIRNANKRFHSVRDGRNFHEEFNDTQYTGELPEFEIFLSTRLESFLIDKVGVRFLLDEDVDVFFDTFKEDKVVDYFRHIFDEVILFAINKAKIDKNLNYIIFVTVELFYRGYVDTIEFRYTNKQLTGNFHSLFDMVNSISDFETESGMRIQEKFPINDITFFIDFIPIHLGKGRRANKITNPKSNRSIIQISENNTTCLGSAILVGLSKHNQFDIFKGNLSEEKIKSLNKYRKNGATKLNEGIASQSEIKQICDGNNHTIRGKLVPELYRICKVDIKSEGNDFADVIIFERALNIKIVIQNAKKTVLHNDKTNHNSLILFLYLNDFHFDYMPCLTSETKIDGYYQKENNIYCRYCLSTDKKNHIGEKKQCKDCNKTFMGQDCFDLHISKNHCKDFSFFCVSCGKTIKILKNRIHTCGEFFCFTCKVWVHPQNKKSHKCFMPKLKVEDKTEDKTEKTPKYLFFDFESRCVDKLPDICKDKNCFIGCHHMNYVFALDLTGKIFIEMFDPIDVVDKFCQKVFSKEFQNYTLIALYGKGYDFVPILRFLEENNYLKKAKLIRKGRKIMYLKTVYNIRLVDAFNLIIQTPLRDYYKVFGIKERKGNFPHLFNRPENYTYKGKTPDKKFYGYNRMTKEQKLDFDKWYESIKDKDFVFMDELKKYCKQDVIILREGCFIFRKMFLDLFEMDPFKSFTLAQLCMKIYRTKFLKESTIAIVKEYYKDIYSKLACQYLVSLNNENIQHALKGGEVKLPLPIKYKNKNIKVDGFDKTTNTVYQFHGCYFHGCPHCYSDSRVYNQRKKAIMGDVLKKTEEIDAIIRSKYNLVVQWECELKKEVRKIKLDNYVLPPFSRDSLHGGRTENLYNYYLSVKKGEKISFIDVVSLYPYIMFNRDYPLGHHIKILNPKSYYPKWFGLIQCKILPPNDLWLPVMPYKVKTDFAKKLVFGLCRKCMKKHQTEPCEHSIDDRAITVFSASPEIELALQQGYKILKIYEVWHWKEKSNDLFKGYMRAFLKIKLENSVVEKADEENYRKSALSIGITLGEIKDNPGLRFISKICLNSLWGRFCMNLKHKESKYVTTNSELVKLISDERYENFNMITINDNLIEVQYNKKDVFIEDKGCNTNVFIGIFTTSYARQYLYKMAIKFGKRVLYMDTDSLIIIHDEKLEIGSSLGDWNLDKKLDGSNIREFASLAGKDYGFKLDNYNRCNSACKKEFKETGIPCKIIHNRESDILKGFRKDSEFEEKVTIENRKKLLNNIIKNIEIETEHFTITKTNQIKTINQKKIWEFQMGKRISRKINENIIITYPFGYRYDLQEGELLFIQQKLSPNERFRQMVAELEKDGLLLDFNEPFW